MDAHLLSIGHGYTAQALAPLLTGWQITGTTRDQANFAAIEASAATPLLWPGEDITPMLAKATHLLISTAPGEQGCPVLDELGREIIKAAPNLKWVGYLSTTAVYGDHQGGWVDEGTPLTPTTTRGGWRVNAEQKWQSIPGLPLHIFRLAGIYGPGRGPFAKLRSGTARRIVKSGQVFSRIYVDDIAQVLAASIAQPNPGRIYNVCDDDPAPPETVIAHAAVVLGLPLPPAEDFATAEMTPMARSFYSESKRVRNARIKTELGVILKYPDYRAGLAALMSED